MAFTAVVTKGEVREIGKGMYSASINYTINDGTQDVLSGVATAKYNANAPDLSAIQTSFELQMKGAWDKYASEQVVKTAAAFDTMVTTVQTAANTYINQ